MAGTGFIILANTNWTLYTYWAVFMALVMVIVLPDVVQLNPDMEILLIVNDTQLGDDSVYCDGKVKVIVDPDGTSTLLHAVYEFALFIYL